MQRHLRIKDSQYGRYLVAGDEWDGRVYHQPHDHRVNSIWLQLLTPKSDGLMEFRDMKHGMRLANGELYARGDDRCRPVANIWGQDSTAQWKIVNANPATGAINLVDQSGGGYLQATEQGLRYAKTGAEAGTEWLLEDISNIPFTMTRLALPPGNVLAYYIDLSWTPFMMLHSDITSRIDSAMSKWVEAFSHSDIRVTAGQTDRGSANIVFQWGTVNDSTEAAYVPGGGAVDLLHGERPGPVTVTFDKERSWGVRELAAWQMDLLTVTCHELGHVFGLGHTKHTYSVMQEKLDTAVTWILNDQPIWPYDYATLCVRYSDVMFPNR
jgi:hypothetical protein